MVSGTRDQGVFVAKEAIFVTNVVTFTTFEVTRARDKREKFLVLAIVIPCLLKDHRFAVSNTQPAMKIRISNSDC